MAPLLPNLSAFTTLTSTLPASGSASAGMVASMPSSWSDDEWGCGFVVRDT